MYVGPSAIPSAADALRAVSIAWAICAVGRTDGHECASATPNAGGVARCRSVIVSAPEETIAIITDIVTRIDTSITDISDTKIFHLEHADAVEMADILSSLYGGVSGSPL